MSLFFAGTAGWLLFWAMGWASIRLRAHPLSAPLSLLDALENDR